MFTGMSSRSPSPSPHATVDKPKPCGVLDDHSLGHVAYATGYGLDGIGA
jgi:hypothetical protein